MKASKLLASNYDINMLSPEGFKTLLPEILSSLTSHHSSQEFFSRTYTIITDPKIAPANKFYALYLLFKATEHENLSLAYLVAKSQDFLCFLRKAAQHESNLKIASDERGKSFFNKNPTEVQARIGVNFVRLSLECLISWKKKYGNSNQQPWTAFSAGDQAFQNKLNRCTYSHFIGKNYELSQDLANWNYLDSLPITLASPENEQANKNEALLADVEKEESMNYLGCTTEEDELMLSPSVNKLRTRHSSLTREYSVSQTSGTRPHILKQIIMQGNAEKEKEETASFSQILAGLDETELPSEKTLDGESPELKIRSPRKNKLETFVLEHIKRNSQKLMNSKPVLLETENNQIESNNNAVILTPAFGMTELPYKALFGCSVNTLMSTEKGVRAEHKYLDRLKTNIHVNTTGLKPKLDNQTLSAKVHSAVDPISLKSISPPYSAASARSKQTILNLVNIEPFRGSSRRQSRESRYNREKMLAELEEIEKSILKSRNRTQIFSNSSAFENSKQVVKIGDYLKREDSTRQENSTTTINSVKQKNEVNRHRSYNSVDIDKKRMFSFIWTDTSDQKSSRYMNYRSILKTQVTSTDPVQQRAMSEINQSKINKSVNENYPIKRKKDPFSKNSGQGYISKEMVVGKKLSPTYIH